MVPICVYSHSEYSDVLQICKDYHGNRASYLLTDIAHGGATVDKFQRVVRYDSTVPYASRLLKLKDFGEEYLILMHDIDIPLHIDETKVEGVLDWMKSEGIDRVDFQNDATSVEATVSGEFVKQVDVGNYIYNVNPSIWKVESLLKIARNFSYATYRTIEYLPTQLFAKTMNIYKCRGNSTRIGYMECPDYFQYMHITHHGQWLPRENNYLNAKEAKEYAAICDKYLRDSKRPFRTLMW
jgi:hypothetical protein